MDVAEPVSLFVFARFRQHLTLVESIEGLWSRERALGGDVEPETVIGGAVSSGLFAVLGGQPLAGRTFTEAEDRDNAKVVVLGHGVWQRRFGGRTSILGTAILIDREPHEAITTVEQFLADSLGPQRFRATLLLLGAIGLALAGLGIYGITSRAVEERTAELGVRLALGATPASLMRMVVWHIMRVVIAGLGVGVIFSLMAANVLIEALPNLEDAPRAAALAALIVLALVALAAAIIPSRRAVSLTPTVALRSE